MTEYKWPNLIIQSRFYSFWFDHLLVHQYWLHNLLLQCMSFTFHRIWVWIWIWSVKVDIKFYRFLIILAYLKQRINISYIFLLLNLKFLLSSAHTFSSSCLDGSQTYVMPSRNFQVSFRKLRLRLKIDYIHLCTKQCFRKNKFLTL